MNNSSRDPNGRRRPKNVYTTKSGKTIKLNQSMGQRIKARKNFQAASKAAYLSTLPKNPFKRFIARLAPRRLAAYWLSRQGLIMGLKLAGIGIVVFFFITVGVFAYFRKDLPKIKDISGDKLGGSITYYDRTGKTVLWQDYDAVKRVPVEDKEMSPFIKQATVAIEDKDFYKHGAFDVRGILRAGVTDVTGGGAVQGGSTISQQLVKLNQQWTNDRTLTRKVKELILAVELEREYSKDDILTGYLNIAPYGGVEYGVESAARDYFNISAKDLSLAQSSLLASIPKSPNRYSPYSSPKYNPSVTADGFDSTGLIGRQQYILEQMVKQKMITRKQADDAKKVDVLAGVQSLKPKYQSIQAPYFVLAAKSQLEKKYSVETVKRGGWRITTTLNTDLQKVAEDKVNADMPLVRAHGGDEAAFVAEDVKTGQIVSLVGGVGFADGSDHAFLNFASNQKISPGSSFKPYDYTALMNFNTNIGAGSVLYDQDTVLPGYKCDNHGTQQQGGNCLKDYDFKQPGPITLRYALGGSRNVPAVKAMLTVGTDKTIGMATSMMGNPNAYKCYQTGTDVNNATPADEAPCYGSSAIGDGAYVRLDDHVNGLTTIARNGSQIPRTYILKITDSSAKTIDEWKQPVPKQVVKADAAYIVNMMASDPNASYLPTAFKFHTQKNGWHFAVKTGTTNDNFDGLMTSWSTQYAAVSWVGYHTRQKPITGISMEYLTEPITRGWMEAAHTNLPAENWVAPTGIKTLPAYIVRSKVSSLGEVVPSPANDLFPSYYQSKSTANSSAVTDKVSNKLATSCTPELARQTLNGSNVSSFNVDQWNGGSASSSATASTGSSNTATANDDVHTCGDAPPSITITAPGSCPSSGCTITATATQGTHALTDDKHAQFPGTVNFTVNGQIVKSFPVSESPSTVSFTYSPTSSGQITLSAQVIDSVLYQATDTATLTASASTALGGLTGKISGPKASFSWTGGQPAYTVFKTATNTVLCNSTSATECTSSLPITPAILKKGDSISVKDSSGATTTGTVD